MQANDPIEIQNRIGNEMEKKRGNKKNCISVHRREKENEDDDAASQINVLPSGRVVSTKAQLDWFPTQRQTFLMGSKNAVEQFDGR